MSIEIKPAPEDITEQVPHGFAPAVYELLRKRSQAVNELSAGHPYDNPLDNFMNRYIRKYPLRNSMPASPEQSQDTENPQLQYQTRLAAYSDRHFVYVGEAPEATEPSMRYSVEILDIDSGETSHWSVAHEIRRYGVSSTHLILSEGPLSIFPKREATMDLSKPYSEQRALARLREEAIADLYESQPGILLCDNRNSQLVFGGEQIGEMLKPLTGLDLQMDELYRTVGEVTFAIADTSFEVVQAA